MDDIKKILKLVADKMISPEDAAAIFDRWKAQGREVLLDSSALNLAKSKEPVQEIKNEDPQESEILGASRIHDFLSSEMKTLVAKILKMETQEISLKVPMKNYGIDSVSASEITMHYKEKYQIPITPPMLFEVRNLEEFVDQLVTQFHDKIEDYYREGSASSALYDDVKIPVPGIAAEDDQDVAYIKDEALFEGKRDFESMWSALEEEENQGEPIGSGVTSASPPKGNSLIISVKDEILEFVSFGKGEPLLLIGGLGAGQLAWQFLLPSLMEKHKVIIFYPPGHGKSTLAKSVNSMSDIAALLSLGLEQLNIIDPISVIGHSSGGIIALEFALHFPAQVKSLTLISSSSKATVQKEAYEKATREFEKIKHLIRQASDLVPYSSAEMMEYFKSLFKDYDITDQLKMIRCPSLIFSGDEDEYIPLENSKIIQQSIPGSRLVTIPHAGHFALLSHSEDILKVMLEFV